MTSESSAVTSHPARGASPRAGRRRLEAPMLWTAIALAGALLMLVVLGASGALPYAALTTCGTVLVYLCAALVLLAVLYAVLDAVPK